MQLPKLALTFRFRPGRWARFRLGPRRDAVAIHRFHGDARRAPAGSRPRDAAAPPHGRRIGRRTLMAALAVAFVAGSAMAVLGSRGILDVIRSSRELGVAQARLDRQQETVAELRREVQKLREDRLAVERIARESLGYVRPGEITFLLPDEGPNSGDGAPASVPRSRATP
jgi:cell division protein FtsB